ncbi:hypothetical protein BJ965_007685 [Streptomyces luteogriseus]|uniref:Secreted protein n=1 Tax=Streptomyces luteogriseus TaxID=68233 RepID=A0A7W7DVN9_9ACTN|nr:hypothetical protein [Streptomyces luteogriseus]
MTKTKRAFAALTFTVATLGFTVSTANAAVADPLPPSTSGVDLGGILTETLMSVSGLSYGQDVTEAR